MTTGSLEPARFGGCIGIKASKWTPAFIVVAITITLVAPAPALANRKNAVRYLKAHGYSPVNKGQYHRGQTLRFLIGTRAFGCCAGGFKAFFFVQHEGFQRADVHYASRSGLHGAGQSNKTIALRYGRLYRLRDPNCCPTGGKRTVRFRWNGTRVRTLESIPSPQRRRDVRNAY